MYKWIRAVETHAVQGSTVIPRRASLSEGIRNAGPCTQLGSLQGTSLSQRLEIGGGAVTRTSWRRIPVSDM